MFDEKKDYLEFGDKFHWNNKFLGHIGYNKEKESYILWDFKEESICNAKKEDLNTEDILLNNNGCLLEYVKNETVEKHNLNVVFQPPESDGSWVKV